MAFTERIRFDWSRGENLASHRTFGETPMRLPQAIAVALLSPALLVTTLGSAADAQTRVRRYYRAAPVQVRPIQVRPAPVRRSVQIQRAPSRTGQVLARQSQDDQNRSRPTRTRTSPTRPEPERTPIIKDEIPESALLTQRGNELANRLRILRLSEARMGEKHPSYESVQNEINDIKRELTAWSADEGWDSADASVIEKLPSMNERDLKQLVIQLVGKIGQLEARVATLEESPAAE